VGFFHGLVAPFRGVAFVARHHLWWYLLLPALINLVLVSATIALAIHLVRERFGTPDGLATSILAWIGIAVVSALLALLLFIVGQAVVGAPFVDSLTERTEALVRGEHPRVGLLTSSWQAVWHGLLKGLLYAVALLLTLALSALTVVGGLVWIAVSALFLAFDGFDYPLARRKVGFGGKWRYLVLHPGQTLGYCVGATLLYLVPLAIVVAPAFAAVGATLAYLDTDTHTAPGDRHRATSRAADGRASPA
jgi:CysZ protein